MSSGDSFILDVVDDDDDGVPTIHSVIPTSVLVVHDAADLQAKLEAFADPVKNKAVPNTKAARRWYVEKILPALRYYCLKLQVTIPEWLSSNDHWSSMSDDEKQRLFGTSNLKLKEFMPVNCPDIAVVRDQ